MAFGSVMGMLVVEGFLITTLDTAVRLNRYLLEELWKNRLRQSSGDLPSSAGSTPGCRCVLMVLVAWNEGWKSIWPLFGSANQLLAALTLIAVTVWLHRAGKNELVHADSGHGHDRNDNRRFGLQVVDGLSAEPECHCWRPPIWSCWPSLWACW